MNEKRDKKLTPADWALLRILTGIPQGTAAASPLVQNRRQGSKKQKRALQAVAANLAAWREKAPAELGWFLPIDVKAAGVAIHDTAKFRVRVLSTGLVVKEEVILHNQGDDRTKYALRLKRDQDSFVRLWRLSWEANAMPEFINSPYYATVGWGERLATDFLVFLGDKRPQEKLPETYEDAKLKTWGYHPATLAVGNMPEMFFRYLEHRDDPKLLRKKFPDIPGFESLFRDNIHEFVQFLQAMGTFSALMDQRQTGGWIRDFDSVYDIYSYQVFRRVAERHGIPRAMIEKALLAGEWDDDSIDPDRPDLEKHIKKKRKEVRRKEAAL